MDKEKVMEWKFKKDAESQGSSDGFWYDLTGGGYITPEDILEDSIQLSKLERAIGVVRSFENALERNDLINEF